MLYLVTGANGTGKTLLTLKHVKELADREARPVCYNGRFDLNPDGPLASWKRIDIKDWQSEPDGTIFFVDECHNDFPVRPASAPVPDYVRMLAEHRKRGFDFFIITQHPQNIDMFVRRLIGNPGWHRHLKRVAGAQLVSQLQWDAVNPNCEKPGSGNTGQVQMVAFPKEVYGWYHSAQLHTGKRKIPRAAWVLLACAVLVPLLGWLSFRTVYKNVTGKAAPGALAAAQGQGVPGGGPGGTPGASRSAPMTAAEYAALNVPRFPGLPFTAAKYDELTKPTDAPYPAACLDGVRPGTKQRECRCFTQQATFIPNVAEEMCRQIAREGFFLDWKQPGRSGTGEHERVRSAPAAAAAPAATSASAPAAGLVVFKGESVGGIGKAWLASPGMESTAPVFGNALEATPSWVGLPSAREARDAAVLASMRDGQWSRR